MAYDAKAHGCRCDECILSYRRAGGPVPSELTASDTIIVGEAPGREEVEVGRPFVGDAGRELARALGIHGFKRSDFAITNVLSCRPPGNEYSVMVTQWRNENKRRKKLNQNLMPGEEPWAILPHPVQCCLPRLRAEIAQYKHVICLGDTAYKTVTSSNESITAMRGSPHEGWWSLGEGFTELDPSTDETRRASELLRPENAEPIKIVPTFHPALILRQKKWTAHFRGDLGRAMRWFRARLNWRDPRQNLHPTPRQLREFLAGLTWAAYDLETDAKEAMVANIRLFGIGTPEEVMVVPFLSTDGHTKFYTEADLWELRKILSEFMESREKLKFGWNSICYDGCVLRARWGITVHRHLDGILLHHDTESELPHTLGFVGTTLTDVPAWKHKSDDPLHCDDATLTARNFKDVAVTAALRTPLEQALQLHDQVEVCRKDHRVQAICAGLHWVGMLVDPVARNAHDKDLLGRIVKYRKICRDISGDPNFNPNSPPQIGEILFEKWGLPPVAVSEKTGAPSTDDDALRTYRVNFNLTDVQKTFIEALRKVRWAVKMRGTNIVKLRPSTEKLPFDPWAEDSEETEQEREYRRKKDVKKSGILLADGRVHSSFTAHVPVTGRLASRDPNIQNWSRKIRDLIIPAPGNVFVSADMDQLELRYAAAHWDLQRMLEILHAGRDPHHETLMASFGKAAEDMYAVAVAWAASQPLKPDGSKYKPKDHKAYGRARDFGKRLRYACQFGALAKTVHGVISAVEDDDGNLIYADVSMTDTSLQRDKLLSLDPEYQTGWNNEVETWRRNGFLRERVWGRRRDFLDGEEFCEIVNFPVQSACAAIVHDATFDLLTAIPFEKWGPGTGLVHQGHDALTIECPEEEAKRVAGILVECMTRTYPGLDITFTAEAKITKRWC